MTTIKALFSDGDTLITRINGSLEFTHKNIFSCPDGQTLDRYIPTRFF